jgi:twinkle protein
MLGAVSQGYSCCIASMEMQPEKTLGRMVQQHIGTSTPTEKAIRDALSEMNANIWLFDLQGTAKRERLLDVFQYAFTRYGVRQFVVDSLAKVGMGEDDYNGQKGFVDALGDFAKKTGCHVHLVAHARKGADEYAAPGKMDVKGTGALTDMVDNVMCVFRNKAKERDLVNIDEGRAVRGDRGKLLEREEIVRQFDGYLICDKHREDGSDAEGMYGLYFDSKAQIYNERQVVGEF